MYPNWLLAGSGRPPQRRGYTIREMTSAREQSGLSGQRTIVLHNRYRHAGGEERYVEQLVELLGRRAAHAALLQRASADGGRLRAGAALLAGGLSPAETGDAVRAAEAGIVHAHNVHPAFGHRALTAARAAGAAVVLHLHNYRLFCATGIVFRDGGDCTLCAPRRTRHGFVHNCRGSRAEAAAYAAGLGHWQRRLIESVDLFVTPTRQLARDLAELGLEIPVEPLPTWLPDGDFAASSLCADGAYGLFAGRITEEKGVLTAIEAAAIAGVPLRVAGDGPALPRARELADELKAPVEFLGRLNGQAMVAARLGAAYAVLPSLWREVLPFSALEALAAGLPLIVSDRGGLPELTASELVFPAGDAAALAERMRRMHEDRAVRAAAGEQALARARERYSEQVFEQRLADVYDIALERRRAG